MTPILWKTAGLLILSNVFMTFALRCVFSCPSQSSTCSNRLNSTICGQRSVSWVPCILFSARKGSLQVPRLRRGATSDDCLH